MSPKVEQVIRSFHSFHQKSAITSWRKFSNLHKKGRFPWMNLTNVILGNGLPLAFPKAKTATIRKKFF
jgi:hypothetical protein